MKICVLDKCTLTVGDIDFGPLSALGDVRFYDLVESAKLAETIADAEVLLVNKAVITAEIMDRCPSLRYIGLFATGYNNIDTEAAKQRGILVCNVPAYSTDSVAQLTFAFILMFATSLPEYNRSVQDGSWIRSLTFSYFPYKIGELSGKTLGIIGMGTIGAAVAKIGAAFNMNILYHSRSEKNLPLPRAQSLEQVFAESDFLTIHCPLTPQTEGMVNAKTLALMKPTAFLINTSRGGVIVEPDLAAALKSGTIAGAGLDVMTKEPMTEDNILLGIPNCVITPHVAWASIEARRRLISKVAENITAYAKNAPINVVNP